jgi:hypothetical protein
MGKNEFERTVVAMKKLMNKFADWGLSAGFVYTTEDGLVHFYGSQAIGDVIDQHQSEIMHHPAFSHSQSEEDPDFFPEEAGRWVSIENNIPDHLGFNMSKTCKPKVKT